MSVQTCVDTFGIDCHCNPQRVALPGGG